jgi:hypothetical protein
MCGVTVPQKHARPCLIGADRRWTALSLTVGLVSGTSGDGVSAWVPLRTVSLTRHELLLLTPR